MNLDKPYGFGSLSDEVVLLLRSLGISEVVLRRKQQEHSDFLSASTIYPIAAFRFLTYTNKTELAERVILNGIEPWRDRISSLINQEFSKLLNAKGEQNCRVMIHHS